MGSAGGAWVTGDTITAARANQKSILVDTGANLNSAAKYAGMHMYCTSTGNGYTVDNEYVVKADGSTVVNLESIIMSALGYTPENIANKGAANGYPNLNASGVIPSAQIPLFYGDGSDGAVTISSNTTVSRDMNYSSLTVNTSIILNTAGNIIRTTGTLANSGTITDTISGGAGGPAGNGGAAVGSGANGNNGGNGQPGTAGTIKNGYQGGSGGYGGGGGGSGGGGNGSAGAAGGNGGAGGAGGGIVVIYTSTLNNTGTITVAGTAGSSGNAGSNSSGGTYGGGGGGGGAAGNGGGGGTIKLVYKTLTSLGTVSVSGGAAGASVGGGGNGAGSSCTSGPGHSNAGGGGGGGGSSGYGSGGRGGQSQGAANYGTGGTGGCNAPNNATSGTNTAVAGSNGVLIQDNV